MLCSDRHDAARGKHGRGEAQGCLHVLAHESPPPAAYITWSLLHRTRGVRAWRSAAVGQAGGLHEVLECQLPAQVLSILIIEGQHSPNALSKRDRVRAVSLQRARRLQIRVGGGGGPHVPEVQVPELIGLRTRLRTRGLTMHVVVLFLPVICHIPLLLSRTISWPSTGWVSRLQVGWGMVPPWRLWPLLALSTWHRTAAWTRLVAVHWWGMLLACFGAVCPFGVAVSVRQMPAQVVAQAAVNPVHYCKVKGTCKLELESCR